MKDKNGKKIKISDCVFATPKDGDFNCEFSGTIVSNKRGYIQVEDMEGHWFDCDEDQLEIVDGD